MRCPREPKVQNRSSEGEITPVRVTGSVDSGGTEVEEAAVVK